MTRADPHGAALGAAAASGPGYPLSALVGQDDLVEALLVCAVNPAVGGVLVRGERGTAKSTAVRALAPMLGDAAPLVEVPLGATLDRLVGSLDVRAALGEGFARAFREVDVLVAPTVAALPHRIGEHAVQIDGREANTLDAFTRLASPQNMAGLPALSIPCGFSAAGLPIGMQLIAAHGRDDLVLALGAAYQRETDWHLRRPPLD